jgi:hypothetical protein
VSFEISRVYLFKEQERKKERKKERKTTIMIAKLSNFYMCFDVNFVFG